MESSDLWKNFTSWCFKQGVLAPKVEFPAVFEHGLVGVKVTKDIQVGEHMIYVPHNLLLSVKSTFDHEILGPILEDFPSIHRADDVCLILSLRIIYETNLDANSFWHDWIKVLPVCYHTYEWSPDEIGKC